MDNNYEKVTLDFLIRGTVILGVSILLLCGVVKFQELSPLDDSLDMVIAAGLVMFGIVDFVYCNNRRYTNIVVDYTPLTQKDLRDVKVELLSDLKHIDKYYLDLEVDGKKMRIMSNEQSKIRVIASKLGIGYYEIVMDKNGRIDLQLGYKE